MQLQAPCDFRTAQMLATETRAAMLLESMAAESGGVTFAPADTLASQKAIALAQKGGLLTPEACVRVRDASEVATRLKRLLDETTRAARGDDASSLAALAVKVELVEPLDNLCAEISRTIDEEAMEVRDSFSSQLRKARNDTRSARQRVERAASAAMAGAGKVSLEERNGRMLLVVSASAAGRGALSKARQMGTAAGGNALIELPALVALNDKLASATAAALEEERRALSILTSMVRDSADAIEVGIEAIGAIDAACCRSRFGAWSRGVVADVCQSSDSRASGPYKLRLDGLAHPLLLAARLDDIAERREQRRRSGSRGGDGGGGETSESRMASVVRNDVRVPHATHAAILTGPNTGGKTSLLKAVALACMCAHAGIPITCSREPAIVPHLSNVLADIGDEQSLAASLSTFSAHATRIADIFDVVLGKGGKSAGGGGSLVLLDELGTGTEPAAGAALGASVIRALADGFRHRGETSMVLATTHQGELKALKYEDGLAAEHDAPVHIENACVEFDEQEMLPTYQLLWGVPGRSHGLNVARKLGLEEGVVQSAAALLGEEHEAANAVVATLEGSLGSYRRDVAAAQETLRRTRMEVSKCRNSNASMYDSEVKRRRDQMESLQKHFRAELERVVKTSPSSNTAQTTDASAAGPTPSRNLGKKKLKKLAQKTKRAESSSAQDEGARKAATASQPKPKRTARKPSKPSPSSPSQDPFRSELERARAELEKRR